MMEFTHFFGGSISDATSKTKRVSYCMFSGPRSYSLLCRFAGYTKTAKAAPRVRAENAAGAPSAFEADASRARAPSASSLRVVPLRQTRNRHKKTRKRKSKSEALNFHFGISTKVDEESKMKHCNSQVFKNLSAMFFAMYLTGF